LAPEGGWQKKARSQQVEGIEARKPRREFTPSDPADKLIVLFSRIDLGGPWCLTKITPEGHAELLGKLRSFETMTVTEIFNADGTVGKDYEIANLPNSDACQRLVDLELDDRDRISRLTVGSTKRCYGFREGNRFYVLWWDAAHEIWPSRLKNT